jgi:hypothetical protein
MVAGDAISKSGVSIIIRKLPSLCLRRVPLGKLNTLVSSKSVLKFSTHSDLTWPSKYSTYFIL